jgi:predicted secreted protein
MFKSLGTLLKRNGTTIAEVNNISGPSFSMGTMETTSHDSAGGWKQFVTTLKDGGEVSFEINFDPVAATHGTSGLLDDFVDGTLQTFTITFTDTAHTVWTFTAYVTKFSPSMPVEGKLGASVTLKLSGAPTLG